MLSIFTHTLHLVLFTHEIIEQEDDNSIFSLGFSSQNSQETVKPSTVVGTSKGENGGLVIEYMDFSKQPDNSSYVPDLEQGILQPVEVFDPAVDQILSQIDVEQILKDDTTATNLPQDNSTSLMSDNSRFGDLVLEDKINATVNHSYA